MANEPLENYSLLKLIIRESETIENGRVFYSILKFIKKNDLNLNLYSQKADSSIDENYSITDSAIEVLSFGMYLIITVIGEDGDIEKLAGWLGEKCNDGIMTVEKPRITFLNKLKRSMAIRKLTAENIMSRDVVMVHENTRISDIISLLYDRKVRFLPVLDESSGRVKGIITEGDLIKKSFLPLKIKLFRTHDQDMRKFDELIKNIKKNDEITAAGIMRTDEIHSVAPGTKIDNVILKMNKHKLKRILVVDDGQKLQGIITRYDIFRSISSGAKPGEGKAGGAARGAEKCPGEKGGATDGGIKKFIDYRFEAVSRETKLDRIIEKINASELTFIPVVDENNYVVGIITDDEIFSFKTKSGQTENIFAKISSYFFKRENPVNLEFDLNLTAGAIMKDIGGDTLCEDASFDVALGRMLEQNIKMAVITDRDSKYRGVISRRNIIRNLIS